MENVIRLPRLPKTIERKKVYKIIFCIFVLILALFLYLTFTNKTIGQFIKVPGNPPTFQYMIYGEFGEGQLHKPMDVAVSDSKVYVTDVNNKRVQVFTKDGKTLLRFGEAGSGPGQFEFPYGIDVDKAGHIYVADLYNGKISIFDQNGKFIEYFAHKTKQDKFLEGPGGLRIYDNKLYVTDLKKNRLLIYSLDGRLLWELGKQEDLNAPNAVAVDKNGLLYVVDTGNQKVVVYGKDFKVIGQIDGAETAGGPGIMTNPRGIGIDSKGNIFVVSNLNHTIYAFENSKKKWSFGGLGKANNQFFLPNGLFIDSDNNIYITDTTNNRIAVYR